MRDPTSTADRVRRALRGDARAFDELARTFLRPAYAVALGVLRRPADAEEVAQEALVAAFERLDTCRDPGRFGPWLLQGARNRALSWLKRRRLADVAAAGRDGDAAADGAAEDAERGTLRRQLLAALEAVTPVQREIVLLHDLEGWTHAEIAGAEDGPPPGDRPPPRDDGPPRPDAPGRPGRQPPPPQEAVDACLHLDLDQLCRFTFDGRAHEGTCRRGPEGEGPIACAPTRGGGGGERGPGGERGGARPRP